MPLHAWCGLMMAHPWLGDENLMNCQGQNSFKREIDTSGLHTGNITDTSVSLAISTQEVIWWPLCVSFEHTAQHNTCKSVSESLLSSMCNNQPHFHPSALLIIKLLKHTKHCSMLHSYYHRSALFLLAVEDFIISVVLGNRLTLILTCLFNQLPKETSSLLQALARQHWETYAKFIFSK